MPTLAASRSGYGFGVTTTLSYDEAMARVKDALKAEGFGVLTEIDIQRTLSEKRGVTMRPYTILAACQPALAEEAFGSEADAGLLLPCNVVVYEGDHGTVVAVADPEVRLAVANNRVFDRVAREAKERLQRVVASLPASD